VALPIDLHHSGSGLTYILLLVRSFSRALLIQVSEDPGTTAHSVVRDAIDGWPGGEVKNHHLMQGTGALRSNPVARVLRWEVQAVLAAKVARTAGSVDQELV